MKIAIAGGPGTGKTTMASEMPPPVFHTDDMEYGVQELDLPDSYVIEGTQVARMLRKGMLIPDRVVWLETPYRPLKDGEQRLAQGIHTMFLEWATANQGQIPIEGW